MTKTLKDKSSTVRLHIPVVNRVIKKIIFCNGLGKMSRKSIVLHHERNYCIMFNRLHLEEYN